MQVILEDPGDAAGVGIVLVVDCWRVMLLLRPHPEPSVSFRCCALYASLFHFLQDGYRGNALRIQGIHWRISSGHEGTL